MKEKPGQDLNQEAPKPVMQPVYAKVKESVFSDFKQRLLDDRITQQAAIQGLMAAYGNRQIDIPQN